MKFNKLYLYVSVLWGFTTLFTSCGEDRMYEYYERTAVTRWIYEEMQDWYYWEENLPSEESANFLANVETFFNSILYSSDKYSYIESIEESSSGTRSIASVSYSYGFDFARIEIRLSSVGTIYGILVLYVAPDSPASEAGLKRGDMIITIDGRYVTANNYTTLYGSGEIAVGLGIYDKEENVLIPTDNKTLSPARAIEDNPIYYYARFEHAGKQIGYLVYNHFTGGANDSSTGIYNEELIQVATGFSRQGVDEFILDLRYNNGGYVYCAQILSSILAPKNALQEPLAYMEYNQHHPEYTGYIQFIYDVADRGANLDLNTLYVITGSMTASASEMVINCLIPYMNVIQVGATTEGKNVGSISITDSTGEYPWRLHPIVCRIYNSQMESTYSNWATTYYPLNEFDYFYDFKELGDKEELLLARTLSIIDGTYTEEEEEEEETRSRADHVEYVSSSLERRATPVRIR